MKTLLTCDRKLMAVLPVCCLLINPLVQGQQFHNLNFGQVCDSSKTNFCYWDLSWGGKGACTREVSGNNSYLLIEGKTENAVGFTEQTAIVSPANDIQIIKITARISSENVSGRGAGINVGMYDKEGVLIATKDMGGFYSVDWIKGTTGWNKYSITAICPAETVKIKIGAILFGKGKAKFDDYTVDITPVKKQKPGKPAVNYINAAVDTIMKHSLVRDSVNAAVLKEKALMIAGKARTYEEAHLAVEYLLESLRAYGDHHSFLMRPKEVKNWENNSTEEAGIEFAAYKVLDDCGYIKVPPFHGGNKKLMQAYADSLQAAIAYLYNTGIKGWIIDLRQNTGGNMEPMIAGLGPVFDAEKLGSLVDVNGKEESWYYKKGDYYWENEKGISATDPVTISHNLPIAVLISGRTGSSGEIVVLSFVGNGRTKLFGEPTWGLTTGNGDFNLPGGARMFLASTIMADRTGKKYHGPVEPDELVKPNTAGQADSVIEKAKEWIADFQK